MQYGDEKGKVFVGGLSWDTTHSSMLKYFSRYGEVIDCVVMKNPATGKSRGFGFVTFKDPSCVETVLANGPHVLDGRQIDPKACNPRSMNKGGKSAENLKRKIFIGGLPANCNEDMLKEFFASYGSVVDVVIMYDQQKQRSRGFGFLTFESEESVDRVVREHYVHINGKQVECKKAEPRDIKAADGTTLDYCSFPGMTLVPQPFAAANGLTMNGSNLAGLSAAAAAGSIPGLYQVPQQAWSQPGAQSLRLINPMSPLVTLLDSPYISVQSGSFPSGLAPSGVTFGAGWSHAAANAPCDPSPTLTPSPSSTQGAAPYGAQIQQHAIYNQLVNPNSPFAVAGASQTPVMAYGHDGSGFSSRALAALEANQMGQSSSANLSFSPNVTYTLAHGMAPMAGGYALGASNGFVGSSIIAGAYTGQGDAPAANYMSHMSPAIGRMATNIPAIQQSFHPYRR